MLFVAAFGCGILLGFGFAGFAAPLYWRLLATCSWPPWRATRLFLRLLTALLGLAGHHPYAISCVRALAEARDAAALTAAQTRLRWYCALRAGTGS
jgi:hypothetical protein